MEATAVYNACRHLQSRCKWRFLEGNEWSYVGDSNEFELKEATSRLATFFGQGSVYVVADRRHVCEVPLSYAATSVRDNLKDHDVTVCDLSFTKAMHFSRIGVVRCGQLED
jgi:hypothetical protein